MIYKTLIWSWESRSSLTTYTFRHAVLQNRVLRSRVLHNCQAARNSPRWCQSPVMRFSTQHYPCRKFYRCLLLKHFGIESFAPELLIGQTWNRKFCTREFQNSQLAAGKKLCKPLSRKLVSIEIVLQKSSSYKLVGLMSGFILAKRHCDPIGEL